MGGSESSVTQPMGVKEESIEKKSPKTFQTRIFITVFPLRLASRKSFPWQGQSRQIPIAPRCFRPVFPRKDGRRSIKKLFLKFQTIEGDGVLPQDLLTILGFDPG